jgi:hypothetical protein
MPSKDDERMTVDGEPSKKRYRVFVFQNGQPVGAPQLKLVIECALLPRGTAWPIRRIGELVVLSGAFGTVACQPLFA